MPKREELVAVHGNFEKFRIDLEEKMMGKIYKDSHDLNEQLVKAAREMISDYIYFESVNDD